MKQVWNKLLTTCNNLEGTTGLVVQTQLVDGLLTDLLQVVRFLRVQALTRFNVIHGQRDLI